jgi:RNA polymerase-binding transcription factor DksA
MPSKKKVAKPAKKAPAKHSVAPAKKAEPAKKPQAKKPEAKKSDAKKPAPKPSVPAKKAASSLAPVIKKVVIAPPAKKPSVIKPAAKAVVAPAKPALPVKSTVASLPPLPAKPLKPAFKPVTKTPLPVPKKTVAPVKAPKVVMPDIKTKTVRKYQPDFTKSVLDQPITRQSGPTMRYSDNELTEFREIIQKKLDVAKKELNYLQGLITRKDEMGGDNDDARYMTMEDGSMSMEREQLSQMASRQITFIDHLEKAMMRIENKTYGICRVTGNLIDKARLKAVPHATLSMEAKQMQK